MITSTSIQKQARLTVGAVIGIVVFLCLAAIVIDAAGRNGLDQTTSRLEKTTEHVLPLMQAANDVKLDVLQTQQWLTDVSATRGWDGMNDGFAKAEAYSQALTGHLLTARTHAQSLGLTEVVAELAKVEETYPAFYTSGRQMAQAYIENGPAGGNPLMGAFDKTATETLLHADALLRMVGGLQSDTSVFARTEAETARRYVLWASIGIALCVLASLWASWRIRGWLLGFLHDVNKAARVLTAAAAGNLNPRITGINRLDELGALQHDINRLLDLVEAFTKESEAAMDAAMKRCYYRTIIPTGLPGIFANAAARVGASLATMKKRDEEVFAFVDRNVRSVAETVATNAADLNSNISTIAVFSDETKDKAGVASAAATRTQENMQTVAAAIEELSASVNEIAAQMSRTASQSNEAVTAVAATEKVVTTLGEAVGRIGTVVELINDIAGQTNLLALNATIEAARAGEAGKGFAVVASEVKNLATQTSKSTEEITQQISAVQRAALDVSQSIASIGQRVREIGNAATTVASAVEEQRAVTESISANVGDVSAAASEVTQVMETVNVTAQESNNVVRDISGASSQMATEAERLRNEIGGFMQTLKKAS